MFKLVCYLAESTHYLSTDTKHVTTLVLGSLAESDAIVIEPLWDAVMYIIDKHKVNTSL